MSSRRQTIEEQLDYLRKSPSTNKIVPMARRGLREESIDVDFDDERDDDDDDFSSSTETRMVTEPINAASTISASKEATGHTLLSRSSDAAADKRRVFRLAALGGLAIAAAVVLALASRTVWRSGALPAPPGADAGQH